MIGGDAVEIYEMNSENILIDNKLRISQHGEWVENAEVVATPECFFAAKLS